MKVKKTCLKCGTVWYDKERFGGIGCGWIFFHAIYSAITGGSAIDVEYMNNKTKEQNNTCPSCGSTIVKKEKIIEQQEVNQEKNQEHKKVIEAKKNQGLQARIKVYKGCAFIFIAFILLMIVISFIVQCQVEQTKSENINSALDSANTYFNNENYDSALVYYDKVFKIDKNNKEVNDKIEFILDNKIKPFIEEAEIYFNEKNIDKALPIYEKVLEINPNNEIAKERRNGIVSKKFIDSADTHFNENNYESANNFYDKALNINPNDKTTKEKRDVSNTMLILNDKSGNISVSDKKFQTELNAANNKFIHLRLKVTAFYARAKSIEEAEILLNSLETEAGKKLKIKLENMINQARNTLRKNQIRDFPLLRKEFAKLYSDIYWRDNIEVKVRGTGNSRLEFTGSVFASNANIEDFNKGLMQNEDIRRFRFKRLAYKWIEYDKEYTYYEVDTPADSDNVSVNPK